MTALKRMGVSMRPRKLIKVCLARLRRDEDGVAAVEFSLFAPILFFAGLTAIDLGMALTERMTMDHLLRAGANFAMADPGKAQVEEILETSAKKNFNVVEPPQGDNTAIAPKSGSIYFVVDKYYACPSAPSAKVADPASCGGDYYTFYSLSAVSTYASVFLPEMTFDPSMQVQIR
jgi:pilus assembly protein CpaE